jgi:hypothetical protein
MSEVSNTFPGTLDTLNALDQLVKTAGQKDDLPQSTGLIPDKDYSGPADPKTGATVIIQDPAFHSPVPKPIERKGPSVPNTLPDTGGGALLPQQKAAPAPATIENPTRLFFTGRSGAGKDWLAGQVGARVIGADELIYAAFPAFDPKHLAAILPTIKAWANGVIDKNFPMTPTRILFSAFASDRPGWKGFGVPGFLTRMLIDIAIASEEATAITTVSDIVEYKMLKDSGFSHFHVMTSPQTAGQRKRNPNVDNQLADALDRDAIKKVSAQRVGDKLPVVWNDTTVAIPSPRLWSLGEWFSAIKNTAPTPAPLTGPDEPPTINVSLE